MAQKVKCNSCGGTYTVPSAPGDVTYFHACPDQIMTTPDVLDAANKIIAPATFKPMPNPRNENLMRDPADPTKYVMISEGSGVTEVQ
jgi:hypothetical protein